MKQRLGITQCRRGALGVVALVLVCAGAGGDEHGKGGGKGGGGRGAEELRGDEEVLVEDLVRRGMPELVEQVVAGRGAALRVHVARADAVAAIGEKGAAEKERFFKAAREEYRGLVGLERKPGWKHDERGRFDGAVWRVEWADLIARHWIAREMDQYEISSGLDFDGSRVRGLLHEAVGLYEEAEGRLDDLLVGVRTEEETYLLLGLADPIVRLHEQRDLNSAWASVYLGMIGDREDPKRAGRLADALGVFDSVSRSSKEAGLKYNALLGAGIALREMGRPMEAAVAFDRVRESPSPLALTCRARHEKAKALVAARDFGAARQELEALGGLSAERLSEADRGAAFYIQIAPLLLGYSYAQEAEAAGTRDDERAALKKKANEALGRIAEQGGVWPGIVQVYLDAIAGRPRAPAELTSGELSAMARRQMAGKEFEKARGTLEELLSRKETGAAMVEAWFNLGVCLFQLRKLGKAAEAFEAVVGKEATGGTEELGRRAAEYSYQIRKELARLRERVEDYRKLAEAGEHLAERYGDHPLAGEARWAAALARQEAGDLTDAIRAFGLVDRGSAHYWSARRNIAVCLQRAYEGMGSESSAGMRRGAAQRAVDGWRRLGEDLGEAESKGKRGGLSKKQRKEWIEEARWAAAAGMAGDDLREYQACLDLMEKEAPTGRVLAIRVRCHRGLGQLDAAREAIEDYLEKTPGDELASALLGLAAEMESEMSRLRKQGRMEEAKTVAGSSVPVLEQLLAWTEGRKDSARLSPVVRFSLAKALIQAGRDESARGHLDRLMADDPGNGNFVRSAALLREEMAERGQGSGREQEADAAEDLWARLLEDEGLREHAAEQYWEARYYWLRHQLRHGRAEEVVNGIRAERAWYPDLGGAPWQGKLLALAAEAERRVGAGAVAP